MSITMIRGIVIGAWCATFAAALGVAALGGVSISISTGLKLAVASLVPLAIALKVWGAARPQTVAELLNAVERE